MTTFLYSCKKDNKETPVARVSNSSGADTITINGQAFNAISTIATLKKGINPSMNINKNQRELSITINEEGGNILMLSVVGIRTNIASDGVMVVNYPNNYELNYQVELTANESTDATTMTEIGNGSYSNLDYSVFSMTDYEDVNGYYVEITSCDEINKTVSGNFRFKTYSLINDDEFLFEGEFVNQSYKVTSY